MKKSVHELLEEKRKQVLSEEDKEELTLIEVILANEQWFYLVDPDTAGSILLFLGVPENELLEVYISLFNSGISDNTGKYILIDEDLLWNGDFRAEIPGER